MAEHNRSSLSLRSHQNRIMMMFKCAKSERRHFKAGNKTQAWAAAQSGVCLKHADRAKQRRLGPWAFRSKGKLVWDKKKKKD